MRRTVSRMIAVLCLCVPLSAAHAAEREELLELKHTILNLVDALVENKVISAEQAAVMKAQAQSKAQAQAQAEAAASVAPGASAEPAAPDAAGKKVVRVPYVPEFVKDDIREQVKAELRKEVHDDVVATAKVEKWGTADALPEWVSRLTWYGDIRMRTEGFFFDAENQPNTYPNFGRINDVGGITGPDTFFNFTEDRYRARLRFRLGLDAKLSDEIHVGARLATGLLEEPLTHNQTMGRAFERYQFSVERAFFRWGDRNDRGQEWLVFQFGRLQNPFSNSTNQFLATDLVWDPDLALEGASATLNGDFSFGDGYFASSDPTSRIYLTLGGMPYEETEIAFDDDSSNDKWMLGGKAGLRHHFNANIESEVSAALFDFVNIVGQFNPNGAFGSTLFDWTAPRFQVKGNTMYPIKFDAAGNPTLFGLASDYTLFNVTGQTIFRHFAPANVTLAADYVRNIAFDRGDILARTGANVSPRNEGFQFLLNIGHDDLRQFGDWHVLGSYRYLQRDAVLDALTESNFHRGGTDAKGWTLAAMMGLSAHTWVQVRYMSADEIDLAPLGIDTLMFDINAGF